MKFSSNLIHALGAITVSTGVYMAYSNATGPENIKQSHETHTKTLNHTKTIQQNTREVLDNHKQATIIVIDAPSQRNQLIRSIDNHPTLKQRIQGMNWYKDLLLGEGDLINLEKNIKDAILIEEYIESHPEILIKIEYSPTWNNYLNGNIPPHNIIYGEIPAQAYIDDFKEKNPELYNRIQENPLFQGKMNDTEIIFSEQRSIIEGMLNQQKNLQENPNLMSKYKQYGYTIESIYSSDWRDGKENGFFLINDAISSLENPTNWYPEAWQQFQESETGAAYRAGKIDPRAAFKYINELNLKLDP